MRLRNAGALESDVYGFSNVSPGWRSIRSRSLVTRNTGEFRNTGLTTVEPVDRQSAMSTVSDAGVDRPFHWARPRDRSHAE